MHMRRVALRRGVAVHALVVFALAGAGIAVGCSGDDGAPPAALAEFGDQARGLALVRDYGCAACHVVPGIREPRGRAGPPLERFGLREFVAGALVNTPENLARWIHEPQRVEPGTVMPDLGVTEPESRDIAAYLLSLR